MSWNCIQKAREFCNNSSAREGPHFRVAVIGIPDFVSLQLQFFHRKEFWFFLRSETYIEPILPTLFQQTSGGYSSIHSCKIHDCGSAVCAVFTVDQVICTKIPVLDWEIFGGLPQPYSRIVPWNRPRPPLPQPNSLNVVIFSYIFKKTTDWCNWYSVFLNNLRSIRHFGLHKTR